MKWSHNCCRRCGPFVLVFWCFFFLFKIGTYPTTFPSDKGDIGTGRMGKASPYFSTQHFGTSGGEDLFRNQKLNYFLNKPPWYLWVRLYVRTHTWTQAHAPAGRDVSCKRFASSFKFVFDHCKREVKILAGRRMSADTALSSILRKEKDCKQ